jgi:hypothetical protein
MKKRIRSTKLRRDSRVKHLKFKQLPEPILTELNQRIVARRCTYQDLAAWLKGQAPDSGISYASLCHYAKDLLDKHTKQAVKFHSRKHLKIKMLPNRIICQLNRWIFSDRHHNWEIAEMLAGKTPGVLIPESTIARYSKELRGGEPVLTRWLKKNVPKALTAKTAALRAAKQGVRGEA